MANRKQALSDLLSPEGVVCHGEEETIQLGLDFALDQNPPLVISLEGTLGAGKTQFSKGLVNGWGCDTEASSPSFAIVHEYTGAKVPVFHFDFYRLESMEELIATGYDDCLGEGFVIAEWGDKFPEALPAGSLRLRFEILPDNGRRIQATRQP